VRVEKQLSISLAEMAAGGQATQLKEDQVLSTIAYHSWRSFAGTVLGCLLLIAAAGSFIYAPTFAQVDPATVGQWSALEIWPYVAVHAHLLPTGKVMFIPFADHPQMWDPSTSVIDDLPKAGYNIFCAGHTFLGDGRLIVLGGGSEVGVGVPSAAIYDAIANSWTRLPDMNAGRWYPTGTTLANGDVLVTGGNIDNLGGHNALHQVWQAASNTWRDLTDATLILPLYPWMHLAPNGKVFFSGPTTETRYLDTTGTGKWTSLAHRSIYRDYGTSVMYDDGKVLAVGGHDPPTSTASVIDLTSSTPTWRNIAPMSIARRQLNATILPDGKVLASGGSSQPGDDNRKGKVLYPEIWDPSTETWTSMSRHTHYRGYHSVAVLLPDARVLLAGGNGEPNAEVFSPPYLFKGPRPTITSSPDNVLYGESIFVKTPDEPSITTVNWVRTSSVTHAFNQNQRINHLTFAHVEGGLSVSAPSNRNLCPPGHYLLFILNNLGVPSVAKIIYVNGPPPPLPTIPVAPSNLTATPASSGQIDLTWVDNDGNEAGFKIERSSDGGNVFTEIARAGENATGYSSSNLTSSTTYYYRVRAYNDAGDSDYSNTANATTMEDPPNVLPTAPSNLVATAASKSQINLTWVDNSSNETSFKILRSLTSSNFTLIATVGANTTSFSDTKSLASATKYYYRVRAKNATGDSASSNLASAMTK